MYWEGIFNLLTINEHKININWKLQNNSSYSHFFLIERQSQISYTQWYDSSKLLWKWIVISEVIWKQTQWSIHEVSKINIPLQQRTLSSVELLAELIHSNYKLFFVLHLTREISTWTYWSFETYYLIKILSLI